MISIGEFSKICKVSTKTLRYYAEIDLLSPIEINKETGYRYYAISQLETMLLINRLKSYEFSLDEVKSLISGDKYDFEDRLISMLRTKQEMLESKIAYYTMTKKQMMNDLCQLRQGKPLFSELQNRDYLLVDYEPMNIVHIRQLVSLSDCKKGYQPFFDILYRRIARERLTMVGPPMTIYHSEEYLEDGYDIEFAIPVREYVTGTRTFNPGLCLKSSLQGNYSEITVLYAKMHEWIEQEHYEVTNPPFDVYISNPYEIQSPNDLITDVFLPIQKN